MRYGVRKLALLLLMLAAPAAQAQLWRGPAAVEVRVEDRGAPVAGAELQLRFNGVDPKDGPPALATDSRGRANVSGLAPGSWQVEVRRDGFMTYLAEIEVRENGRLELVQATQLKVAGASRTLDVKISKGRPAPEARAAAPVRETPPIRETPPPARETPPPPRAEPAPAPRVEPTPPPREQPPAPAPQPVTQPVTPAPAPPAQTVQPTPPAVAAPSADSILMRNAKDRTCVECQPGESSLSLERVIPPGGGPGCGGDLAVRLRGTLSELPAGCDVLQITLPEGARYIGYRFEVQDGGESLDCPTAKDCPRGLGRWPADPIVIRGPQKAVVRAAFESGPADRERRAVFTVYFSMTAKR
ncbi:MAG: carboxypeptidase-like regulatory domain-containing protein [Thermoanaerobaculia bacterium]